MKLSRKMLGDFPLNTDREAETYDHVEQLVEHDQPPPVQLDPEHVAFLLKPLLEPLVLELERLRIQLNRLVNDMEKSREFVDEPVELSDTKQYVVNYKERKFLFLYSPVAITLVMSDGGTKAIAASTWTGINFRRGMYITTQAAGVTNTVLIRACDELLALT